VDRKKKLIISIILTGALAGIPGAALAERLEYDSPRDESSTAQKGSCTPAILGKAITNDALSANERIMADAWKSHLHARKAAALEGLD
jgi:hypothetical protein